MVGNEIPGLPKRNGTDADVGEGGAALGAVHPIPPGALPSSGALNQSRRLRHRPDELASSSAGSVMPVCVISRNAPPPPSRVRDRSDRYCPRA